METTPKTTNLDKGTFWKVGIIILSYYAAVIPTSLILGAILTLVSLGDIEVGIIGIYLYYLAIIVMGLLGIRYGVRHVARKSSITKSDVTKIIVWFIIVGLLLEAFNLVRGATITYLPFVLLIIDCIAVFLFAKKVTSDRRVSSQS